ncbi:choice-of-anchor A family protein [Streptacidiphilus sp. P02-A3a]|uniref:choice-of-anchor A family protein n=1 Tax=Streptacidiphilus sp. P02-A3a TaxID=2704468 RepID=UPI0015FA5C41|nr:choice-of-anchor A family protein [Streptacidiphilus sp. P02-A3a]QMU69527.1 choice-of-anchor A family protein [Streptacidiphilus sp. P02-A3a]
MAGTITVLGLAVTAALAVTGSAAGAVTGTGPLEPPLGACTGPACPGTYPPPNNGDFAGRDASINVFVGADYRVRGRAAEVEGKVVTLGGLTVDKSGGGAFNMAVVGVGSRVPPPDGTDFVVVGGAVDAVPGNTVYVGGSDSTTTAYGDLRHGGSLTGTVNVAAPGRAVRDAAAAAPYRHLRRVIEERSHCAAEAEATGTVTVSPSEATFAGDGSSALQVFDVTGDLGTVGHQIGLNFTGIPAGATVLVNLRSEHPVINTYTGTGLPGDQLTELRPKLMWNFPTAATVHITGGAQFQGSVLAGNPNGVTTLSSPGMNGRIYLAGGLVQEGVGGYELHAYDFTGDLPLCGVKPEPSESVTPTVKPSGSTSAHPSESVTPKPSHSHHRPEPSGSRSPGGELANTGADDSGGLLVAVPVAGLLLTGAGVLWLGRRRGSHS